MRHYRNTQTKRFGRAAGACAALGAVCLTVLGFGALKAMGARFTANPWPGPAHVNIVSQQELEGVVRQMTDRTCGPAALATLLGEYFHEPVTEAELYDAALRVMLGDAYGRVPNPPAVTLRGLIGALAAYGYTAYAIEADLSGLEAYFARYAVPAVIHLNAPEPHFTLLLGIVDGWYVLADPSAGQIVMTADELTAYWSGYTLLVRPPAGRTLDEDRLRARLEDVQARGALLQRLQAWL